MTTPAAPFRPDVARRLAGFQAALAAAGYTREGLMDLDIGVGKAVEPWRARATVRSMPAMATLVDLFLLGATVPRDQVESALSPALVEGLLEAGLLHASGPAVRSAACVMLIDGQITLRDFDPPPGTPMAPDHVPSVSLSTALVSNFCVRKPCALGLDLGCGSGFLALRAAAHCRRVIATDINPRSLNFAQMTFALNGLSNIETRLGSLTDPVEGERFGLIASNPPFVISPATDLVFRDSGMRGDRVSEVLLGRFAHLLEEGGWAAVLFNWHHADDDTWASRPRSWVEGRGVDAWLARFRTDDPESYARNWILAGQGARGEPNPQTLASWLNYYRDLGARAMSLGVMVLRKRRGPNWFRVDSPKAQERLESCGQQIERIFDAETLLRGPGGDAAILDARARLVPGVRLEQICEIADRAWTPRVGRLLQPGGLEHRCNVDPIVAYALARCDGHATLGAIVAEVARERGFDPTAAAPGAAPVMAWLARAGYFDLPAPQ